MVLYLCMTGLRRCHISLSPTNMSLMLASEIIYSYSSVDSVGYRGTFTSPALRSAWSIIVHSGQFLAMIEKWSPGCRLFLIAQAPIRSIRSHMSWLE